MGGNTTSGKTPITSGTAVGYVPKQGDIGKEKTCPVNGQPVVVKQDTPAVSFKGEVFYFCCTACMQAFKNNPEKYMK
jgi:YHS domain-containing protein